ncbi:MAG TPA: sigma factor-like helix-turn-helix DNA-binding protein [Thermoleophilaceae bacterium]|jgi:DNA-directed RNA polymerase specialized sigma24 family protein
MSAPARAGGDPGARPARDAAELFRAEHLRLVGLVQGRLGVSREVAEDACSLAWLQLVRRPPRGENVVGWLYAVAKYETFAILRRYRREGEAGTPPEQLLEANHLEAFVAKQELALLARLKPQQRLVLWLRGQGYSYDQIQHATGKSYTWVNRHLSEGRAALRELVAEMGEGG